MPTPNSGDRAPDVRLLDARGRERMLSSYWKAKPAVAVFLRHYG